MTTEAPTQSEEFGIAQEISGLIGKIVSGTATDEDRNRLEILTARRSQLMQPASLRRLQEGWKRLRQTG